MVLLLAHRLEMQVGACSHASQGRLGPSAGRHAGGGMQPWFSGVPWAFCRLTCRWGNAAMICRAASMLLLADMLQTQVGACSHDPLSEFSLL